MSEDINIGAISEALNNKVDLDQLNTNNQGLSYGSGWGMPSDRYINLTLGASGSTYTAPANGYYNIAKLATNSGQYLYMNVRSQQNVTLIQHQVHSSASNQYIQLYMPIKKGDTMLINYTAEGTTALFRFVYAEGEK